MLDLAERDVKALLKRNPAISSLGVFGPKRRLDASELATPGIEASFQVENHSGINQSLSDLIEYCIKETNCAMKLPNEFRCVILLLLTKPILP